MVAIQNVLKPILASLVAIILANCNSGCLKPPGAAELEKQYNDQLQACVDKSPTLYDSCECRKAVDESWGMCDRPEWPRIGRCDYRCEGLIGK